MFFCKKKWICLFFLFTLIHAGNSPKIGLVLSGGGSKGFAHIATLKALDSLHIPIDYIAGTSFGAIVGAIVGAVCTGACPGAVGWAVAGACPGAIGAGVPPAPLCISA